MTDRNIKPNLTATVADAKAEMSMFADIVRAASKATGIPTETLLLSDDFVNKVFAVVENRLKTA